MANTSIKAAFERMWQHVVAQLGNKADKNHTHDYAATSHNHDDKYYTEAEINTKLSGKSDIDHIHDYAASNHGTHVSYSTTAPVMDGTASVGSASTVARSDHKHPTDTSRAAANEVTALKGLVGDVAVSTQINNAVATKSAVQILTWGVDD